MPPVETTVSCPACESADLRPIARVHFEARGPRMEREIVECRGCTHRFLPTADVEQRAIETGYDEAYRGFRRDDYFEAVIRREIRQRLAPRVPPPARVLDVGCGNGEFLQAAAEAGYSACGVDVSDGAVGLCVQRGLAAAAGDYLTMRFDGTFAMITLWDVVEHLKDPHLFLTRSRDLLDENGVLVLKIPGFNRLGFYPIALWSRLAYSVLGAPDHVQYFNRRSLSALLERAGFRDVEWFPPMRFRSRPPTRSLKRLASRALAQGIGAASGNGNLYVIARR